MFLLEVLSAYVFLVHTVLWVLAYAPMILCFGVCTDDGAKSLVHTFSCGFYSMHQ